MLRIHRQDEIRVITRRLEGTLAGDWVDVLEECCREALAEHARRTVVVELDEVTIVDERGEALLRELHESGIMLRGRGIHSQYLVERIKKAMAG